MGFEPMTFSLKGRRTKPDYSNATLSGPDRNRTYKLERGQIYSLRSSPPAQLIHFAPFRGIEPRYLD